MAKRSSLSPTQRTLSLLRANGYHCAVVERWLRNPAHPAGGVRKDAFGCFDLLVCGCGEVVGVQCCSGSGVSAHLRKYRETEEILDPLLEWLKCGAKFRMYAWRKILKKRGGKARIWVPRVFEFGEGDEGLVAVELQL